MNKDIEGECYKREVITAWITKYAMTKGIFSVQAEVCKDVCDEMIAYKESSDWWIYAHRNEWHRTRGEAIARAEEMRKKKISALQKSIKKLESITFQ